MDKTKVYLRLMLDEYMKIRKQLDDNPKVQIYGDYTLDPIFDIKTDVDESHVIIARTMEYIQGLKHDIDKEIIKIKLKLES